MNDDDQQKEVSSSSSPNVMDIFKQLGAALEKQVDKASEFAKKKAASLKEAMSMKDECEKELTELNQSKAALEALPLPPDDDNAKRLVGKISKSIVASQTSLRSQQDQCRRFISVSTAVTHTAKKRLQIAFMFDATGSMAPIITSVKNVMKELVHSISDISNLDVEIGFVAFRDFDTADEAKRHEAFNFTDDPDAFVLALDKIEARGGGDEAEDVLGGFKKTLGALSWRPMNQAFHVLVFIGDAPGHGLYAPDQKVGDSHPGGDPHGLTVPMIASQLMDKDIVLAYLRINPKTDFMMHLFDEAMDYGRVLEEHYTNTVGLKEGLLYLLLASASTSTTNTSYKTHTNTTGAVTGAAASGGVADGRRRDVPKRPATAKPEEVRNSIFRGTIYTLPVTPVNNDETTTTSRGAAKSIHRAVRDLLKMKKMPLQNTQDVFELKVEDSYFAAGEMRFAHHARLENRHNMVAKVYKDLKSNSFINHILELRGSAIAATLANEFCAKLKLSSNTFQYLDTQIYCVEEVASSSDKYANSITHFSLERFVEPPSARAVGRRSDYIKFNNNNGYIDGRHELPQAFSHFTFHACEEQLMVVDVQGWNMGDNAYCLTDPAVLTADMSVYPNRTNVGMKGILAFLRTHVCGETCRKLGLPQMEFDY